MNTTLANQNPQTGLATYVAEPIKLLDTRASGGLTEYETGKRLGMWAATISAGYKEGDQPRVVRDGKIRLHEDMGAAPGIKAALAATENKSITITMLSNDINDCLKQLFCAYGKVKIFGDDKVLTVMKIENEKQVRKTVLAGDPEFDKLLELCKVSTFVPFALAEWDENNNPRMSFPDGLLPYRLRFTSNNSVRAFVESLQAIKGLTHGQLAGVPLDLSIAYKTVMTPQLTRQSVPVWNPVLRVPGGLSLGTRDIQRVLTAGIRDAQQMALPPSIDMSSEDVINAVIHSEEVIEAEQETGEIISRGPAMSAKDVRTVTTGEVPDQRRDQFFRNMQNTPWCSDEYRGELVQKCADAAGVVLTAPSLRELCEVANAEEWAICEEVMCKDAATFHGTEQTKAGKPVVDDDPYAESSPKQKAEVVAQKPPEPTITEPSAKQKLAEPTITEPSAKQKPPEPAISEPAAEPAPKLPKVSNYLTLERNLSEPEQKAAKTFFRRHATPQEVMALVEAAGAINVLAVALEAEQRGLRTFADMMRMLDPQWTEPSDSGTTEGSLNI